MRAATKFSYWVLTLLLLLLAACVALLRQLPDASGSRQKRLTVGVLQERVRQDCDTNTVWAFEDEECAQVCKRPGIYRARNGVCVNALTLGEGVEGANKCSPERGLVAYLVGDPQFGRLKLLCLSLDLGIQDDDMSQPNRICQNGEIDINYVREYPQLKDCKCPPDHFLAVVANTSTVRKRGVCVHENLRSIFVLNKSIYGDASQPGSEEMSDEGQLDEALVSQANGAPAIEAPAKESPASVTQANGASG